MVRLHHVQSFRINGIEVIQKRRRWFAQLIVPPGNVFVRIMGCPIVVLPSAQWLEWERSVENSTRRNLVIGDSLDPVMRPAGLLCRRVPGIALGHVLAGHQFSLEQKLAAVHWSLTALRRLHEQVADWGEGLRQSISHGDATANNVIVDVSRRTACWIDFDTRHRPDVSELDRRTDDLWVFIFSSAVHLPRSVFPDLADLLISAHVDELFLRRFRQRLANEWGSPTVAQWAQAPLQTSTATALRAALLRGIDSLVSTTTSHDNRVTNRDMNSPVRKMG